MTEQYPTYLAGQKLTADLLTAGQPFLVYKTSDLSRTSATLADDNHLTVQVDANAIYVVDGFLHFYTTDATNADINVDWTVPSGASGNWVGIGQPTGATTTDGDVRTVSSTIAAARSFGANTDTSNPLSIVTRAFLVTSSAGTYALSWARTGGAGTVTLLQNSYLKFQRYA